MARSQDWVMGIGKIAFKRRRVRALDFEWAKQVGWTPQAQKPGQGQSWLKRGTCGTDLCPDKPEATTRLGHCAPKLPPNRPKEKYNLISLLGVW